MINEVLCGLTLLQYGSTGSSPNIVWVIKSRRIRWARYVVRVGEKIGVYRVLVGKTEGNNFPFIHYANNQECWKEFYES